MTRPNLGRMIKLMAKIRGDLSQVLSNNLVRFVKVFSRRVEGLLKAKKVLKFADLEEKVTMLDLDLKLFAKRVFKRAERVIRVAIII